MDLDEAFPENPILLMHASGHMAVVNSAALVKVGIDETTPNPPGGMIVRLPDSNEPSGLLQETAIYQVRQELGTPTPEQALFLFEKSTRFYMLLMVLQTAQDGFTDYKKFFNF